MRGLDHRAARTGSRRARGSSGSSRTLPGQECAASARLASSERRRSFRPISRASRCRNDVGQQRDVAAAPAQRRDLDRHHGQAEEQVLAEQLLLHERAQVAVRGRHHAHVDAQRLEPADALELLLLHEPQDLALQRQRHVADLVEEERAAVRELRLADLAPGGPGEGALLVAEQLVLEQVLRDRGAVDRHERALGAARRAGAARGSSAPCRCRSRPAAARWRRCRRRAAARASPP